MFQTKVIGFNEICKGSVKLVPPIFLSENVVAITMKYTWMIYSSFAITRLFFHKVTFIVYTLLPTLSETLYTSVVKFPASTLEHIKETFFQFIAICKMASM
jgi:hypothetical protein